MSDDPAFERLLRSAARHDRQAGVCPDAAMLAAYAEGALDRDERTSVERHAADCERCTEHLALLATLAGPAEPAGGRTAPAGLGWRGWKWLVPAAAAVLVFAVWQRTGPMHEPQQAVQPFAQAERAAPAGEAEPGPPAASSGDEAAPAGPASAPEARPNRARASEERARRELTQQPDTAPRESRPASEAREGARLEDRSTTPAPPLPATAPPLPPAPAPDAVGGARPEAFGSVDALGPRPPLAGRRQEKALAAVPGGVVTAAPNVLVRFTAGRIERSTDGGAEWRTEVADAEAPLRVVACASSEVCWAGGDRGLVLKREPSGDWIRRPFPARSAIVAIEGAGPSSVLVTLSDGRRFRTTDGGATWVDGGGRR